MLYWILEYVKVLAVYLFIMYFWPSVVFRNYLSKKGVAFRFSFCATFMILLLNTTILMIGVVKLLYQWIIRILFYTPLLYIAGKWLWRNRGYAIHIKYLLTDICSLKRFVVTVFKRLGCAVRDCCKKIRALIAPHFLVYVILTILIIYGMIYFSYGAFHERYYGTSDVYVHHSWIDLLLDGRIFGSGVYPEGMHCFVYAMNTLCGVEVYSCLLFLGGIHISTFLAAVYLFFREIFPWKYSGLLVILLYLILRLDSVAYISSMSRLQWTIPQEFAMFTVFLCAAYLLRFLRHVSEQKIRWRRLEFVRDENLLIFVMSLAVSIAVHFYVTIIAFFLCCAIGIFFLHWAIINKQILPLLCAVMCGVLIAMTPMLAALASGIEFQGSIGWAMNVIAESQEAIKESQEAEKDTQTVKVNGLIWDIEDPELITDEAWQEILAEQSKPKESIFSKFYRNSFEVLYTQEKAVLFTISVLLGLLLGVVCRIIVFVKRKAGVGDDPFCGYLILGTASLIFMLLYAGPSLGIVEIVQIGRLGTVIHLLVIASLMIPCDLIMTHISIIGSRFIVDASAVIISMCLCISVIVTGEYHSYLYNYITRYPAVVDVTKQIVQNMKPESYTVVAAFDEIYHIKEYGFHEEAVRFIRNMKEESYTLPTEYVFIYLEKLPLNYAHVHFVDGPSCLARSDYGDVIGRTSVSQAPEFLHSEINDECADKVVNIPLIFNSYTNLEYRTIIFSRLNQWVERFQELYPHLLTTIYEDEAVVCYMFQQNPARLLELAIMD